MGDLPPPTQSSPSSSLLLNIPVPVAVPVTSPRQSSSHHSHSSPSSTSQNNLDDLARHFISPLLGSYRSPPFLSGDGDWFQRRTCQSPLLNLLSPEYRSPWERESCLPILNIDATVIELPKRSLTDQYLQLFRSTPFRLVFPLIDPVLFQSTIDSAYEPGGSISSRACVLSLLAIMAHTQWAPRS